MTLKNNANESALDIDMTAKVFEAVVKVMVRTVPDVVNTMNIVGKIISKADPALCDLLSGLIRSEEILVTCDHSIDLLDMALAPRSRPMATQILKRLAEKGNVMAEVRRRRPQLLGEVAKMCTD